MAGPVGRVCVREPSVVTDLLLGEIRSAFGCRLREVRVAARLSGKEMAARLGWPSSKVSRLENGVQAVSADDLTRWLAVAEAAPRTVDLVMAEWGAIDARYRKARSQRRSESLATVRQRLELSYTVVSLRWYATAWIPGPLQTRAYARRIFESFQPLDPNPADPGELWDLRARIAETLTTRAFGRFHFLLLETLLDNRIYPADVWCEQVNHLIRLSLAGSVQIGILPLSSGLAASVLSYPFTIWDDERLATDTIVGIVELTGAREVGVAVRAFERLWADALLGADARMLLARSRDETARMVPDHGLTGRSAGARRHG
jgi:transcriptional regulator with XRE-family HTH domain